MTTLTKLISVFVYYLYIKLNANFDVPENFLGQFTNKKMSFLKHIFFDNKVDSYFW